MKSIHFTIVFFICLAVFLENVIYAKSEKKEPYCVQVYRKINEELKLGYVKPETKEKIAGYFFDETLSPKERARKTFLAVLGDRIRLLNQNEAKDVVKFLKERVIVSKNDSDIFYGGLVSQPRSVLSIEKQIVITLPEALSDTIFEYAILVHELEHYIQELVASRPALGSFKLVLDKSHHYVDVTYEAEMGAMMSEFEFMSSIPRENRITALEYVKKNKNLFDHETLNLLISILALHHETPIDYVHAQQLGGRYDKEMIQSKAKELGMQVNGAADVDFDHLLTSLVVLPTVVTVGALGTPAAISGVKNFCTKMIAQDTSVENASENNALGRNALLEICEKIMHGGST